MINFKAKILMNGKVKQGYYRMLLDAAAVKEPVQPGQFVNARVENGLQPFLRRPFSIYNYEPGSRTIELVYKVLGEGTRILSEKVMGQSIDVIGPLGNGYELPAKNRRVILVGGGTGLISLYYLTKVLAERRQKETTVLAGYSDMKNIIIDKDFEALGINFMVATEDGSRGYRGCVTDLLKEILNTGSVDTVIFSCGPKPMLKEVVRVAGRLNPDCFVSLEEYMGCGVGACMSCVVKVKSAKSKNKHEYKRICREGPVFRGSQLLWR